MKAKEYRSVLWGAMIYGATLMLGISSFCVFELFSCKVNFNVGLSQLLIPGMIVIALLLAVGGCVSLCLKLILKAGRVRQLWHHCVIGFLVGIFPRLFWGGFAAEGGSGLYPHVDYLPYGLAGLVCCLLLRSLSRYEDDGVRPHP